MKHELTEQEVMTRYLLGDLSEEDQLRFEERYFQDNEIFNRLLAVERALIDDYVNDELSPADRELFERNFLKTPQRREKVEFARSLRQYVSEQEQRMESAADPLVDEIASDQARTVAEKWRGFWSSLFIPRPKLQFAFATAAVLFMVGSTWLYLRTAQLQDELTQFQLARDEQEKLLRQQLNQQHAQGEELTAQVKQEQSQRRELERELAKARSSPPATVSFMLVSGTLRSLEQEKRLLIPKGIESVQLQPEFEDEGEYRSFSVVLRTAEGEEVWSEAGLQARHSDLGRSVVLHLPALILTDEDYILTLMGTSSERELEVIGNYHFGVVRK